MSAADLELLTAIFPHIPAESLRRSVEITGSVELASSWLLENDWRELQAGAQAAAAGGGGAGAGGGGGGEDDDDEDDDEDEDDDDDDDDGGEEDAGGPRGRDGGAPPAKRQRKTVTQGSGSAAVEGATSFWCAFDDTIVHKGHLQLMNLRPKSLGHSRIALSTETMSTCDADAAAEALGDVWTHCSPKADPGYWLVPLQLGDLDDARFHGVASRARLFGNGPSQRRSRARRSGGRSSSRT